MRRDITVGDLCELTGYSRDQLRGLLLELPRFSGKSGAPRVARIFTNQEVLMVVLLCRLESEYGLKRATVAGLCESIFSTLSTPRSVSSEARLVLVAGKQQCDYLEGPRHVTEGLIVPLAPVFDALDKYLVPPALRQRELALPALHRGANNRAVVDSDAERHEAVRGGNER
jgi:hypothetical protein